SGTPLVQASYSYDALGHRVGSSVSLNGGAAVQTHYAWNGEGLSADLAGTGALQTAYVGTDQADQWLAHVDASGTVRWDLGDHLGSVRAVVSAAGAVLVELSYDAFGTQTLETHPGQAGRLRYAGYEFDQETGFYHDAARYYASAAHRFLTQDPTGLGP